VRDRSVDFGARSVSDELLDPPSAFRDDGDAVCGQSIWERIWWESEVVLVLSSTWGDALARHGGGVLDGGCHAVVGSCT
jgi:hypothetical protein